MRIGFYAGSFDPFTMGHLHIVKVASKVFDKVIIGIGVNPAKSRRYSSESLKQAIEHILKRENLTNFECVIYEGLTADVAKEHNADFLIRGLRNGSDYDFEENLALINYEVSDIDTIYFRAGSYGAVSSSMVYELIKRNKDVSRYLPPEIVKLITK
ncbi:MAG: pantetheine-phosphate adenylyltransferase [Clostridia bacterium]|nr:pantetheine-phosphate adenylyltransferase [Clostridia bacterium]